MVAIMSQSIPAELADMDEDQNLESRISCLETVVRLTVPINPFPSGGNT